MSLRSFLLTSALSSASLASIVDFDISVRNGYRTISVDIGTPPVPYNLEFDTGSTSLWVLDGSCTDQCPNASGFTRQTYNLTSTGKAYTTSDTIQYSGGSVSGHVVTDTVTVPGSNVSFILNFADITQSSWAALGADGFFGLASSTIAFTNTSAPFQAMIQQGVVDNPRFGIYQGTGLGTIAQPSPENNGVLTLGGSHEDIYADSEVIFVNTTTPFEVYKVPFGSVTGSNNLTGATNSLSWNGDVVFDTGASGITVPDEQLEALYALTPINYTALTHGGLPYCSDFNNTWSVAFEFGGATFTVTGDQLAQPGYQMDDRCFPPFDSWSSQNVILGARWMRNFYSVFDFGSTNPSEYNVRVGFAPLKEEYIPNWQQ